MGEASETQGDKVVQQIERMKRGWMSQRQQALNSASAARAMAAQSTSPAQRRFLLEIASGEESLAERYEQLVMRIKTELK
jgi:hypothetical protein